MFGAAQVLIACGIWGLAPILYKNFAQLDIFLMLIFRSCSTFATAIATGILSGQFKQGQKEQKNSYYFSYTLCAALVVALDWLIYLWCIANGKIVEATIGICLSPIVCVIIGRLAFFEPINRNKAVAIVLSLAGILCLVLDLNQFPWITLAVTVTSSLISTLRKINPSDCLTSLTSESFILSIFFISIGLTRGISIELFTIDHSPIWLTGLLTFFPAYYYSKGAKKVKISSLGMIGLFRPIIRFLVAIFVLNENLSTSQTLSMLFIFLSLCSFFLEHTSFFQIGKYSENPT